MSPGKRPALKPADPEKLDMPAENPIKIDPDRNKLLHDDCILDQYIIFGALYRQPVFWVLI